MNTVKKITLISLITAFMCCTIFCVPTSALLLNDEVTSIEYLDNGDRIETVISYKAPDKSSVTVNSSTKTATKTNFSTQKTYVPFQRRLSRIDGNITTTYVDSCN